MEPSVDSAVVMARRLRAAALIALGSLASFAAVELHGERVNPAWVVGVKSVQASVVVWTLLALRRPQSWERIARICLVFVGTLLLSASVAAIGRGDTTTLPVLLVMIAMASAVLVPWGAPYQSAVALLALVALVMDYVALGGLGVGFPFPGLPILLTFVVSIFMAWENARHQQARRGAEAALRESEQRFRTMAEDAPVLIWMTDAEGRGVFLNAACARLLGRPFEASGTSGERALVELVHPDDHERVRAAVAAGLAARAPWEAEYRVRDAVGGYRWLAARGAPRFAIDGTFEGHFGIATDVTARREEADALAAARNAALEATRLKSDFLATMSHEIRTPMHGIFGMTELALDTDDPEERRDFLERARACARTLMGLLDEILDFSKIEAGRLELRPVDFDVRHLAHEVIETVTVPASRKRLELLFAVDENVPERLHGDPGRVRQVLTNLIGNAVKFTPRGEVELRVDRVDGARGATLRCRVRDTGIGIAPDKLASIFEAFTQANRAIAETHGGTGLGLAISQRLVELMGGRLAVTSTLGAGSTFTVELPLAPATTLAAPIRPLIAGLSGVRILVVDDNTTNRLIVMKALETRGCTVALASSGIEAFDLAQSWLRQGNPFDVVVLDFHMPGMDGAETARRFRAHGGLGTLPIVLLSSVETSLRSLKRDLGRVWTLTKPVRQAELVRTVHEVVTAVPRAAERHASTATGSA
jgi:two-component system sensor histidine kinase/response regulator